MADVDWCASVQCDLEKLEDEANINAMESPLLLQQEEGEKPACVAEWPLQLYRLEKTGWVPGQPQWKEPKDQGARLNMSQQCGNITDEADCFISSTARTVASMARSITIRVLGTGPPRIMSSLGPKAHYLKEMLRCLGWRGGQEVIKQQPTTMPRSIAKTTESNIFQKWEMPNCRRGNEWP